MVLEPPMFGSQGRGPQAHIFHGVLHYIADDGHLFRLPQPLGASKCLLLKLRVPLRLKEVDPRRNRQV